MIEIRGEDARQRKLALPANGRYRLNMKRMAVQLQPEWWDQIKEASRSQVII